VNVISETFVPNAPAFCLHNNMITILNLEGEVENLTLEQGVKFIINTPCIICNRPFIEGNLNINIRFYYDVLELFAFLCPCSFCPPTIKGLAEILGIPVPKTKEQEAQTLLGCVKKLLTEFPKNQELEQFCYPLLKAGWKWAEFILLNMGKIS
jgi:ATP-dependent DNA helicase DinG